MSEDDADWLRRFFAAFANPPEAIPIAPVLPVPALPKLLVTPDLLSRLGGQDAEAWTPPLAAACASYDITAPRRLAAFLATIMIESGGLASLTESLNYRPEALLAQWPSRFTRASAQALGRTASRAADQRGIAEAAYGGRMGNGPPGSGDGWQFRGRGLIQLTGRENYARFAARIGMPLDRLPAYLETRDGAAISAAAFWKTAGCNEAADAGDLTRVRRLVNGGTIGLDHVRARYDAACAALGLAP